MIVWDTEAGGRMVKQKVVLGLYVSLVQTQTISERYPSFLHSYSLIHLKTYKSCLALSKPQSTENTDQSTAAARESELPQTGGWSSSGLA